jgi:hypothetical protein
MRLTFAVAKGIHLRPGKCREQILQQYRDWPVYIDTERDRGISELDQNRSYPLERTACCQLSYQEDGLLLRWYIRIFCDGIYCYRRIQKCLWRAPGGPDCQASILWWSRNCLCCCWSVRIQFLRITWVELTQDRFWAFLYAQNRHDICNKSPC